jgi:hypothetical protein
VRVGGSADRRSGTAIILLPLTPPGHYLIAFQDDSQGSATVSSCGSVLTLCRRVGIIANRFVVACQERGSSDAV